jgi:hypothetical protein
MSSILAFLERMNTLLTNAEVPGLFEGDEYASLMTACKEGFQRDGLMLDSPEELYKWFTSQVAKNLHVVSTMNPPENGLASRAATSPALFNGCAGLVWGVPDVKDAQLPVMPSFDTWDHEMGYFPPKGPYDPRWFITGAENDAEYCPVSSREHPKKR